MYILIDTFLPFFRMAMLGVAIFAGLFLGAVIVVSCVTGFSLRYYLRHCGVLVLICVIGILFFFVPVGVLLYSFADVSPIFLRMIAWGATVLVSVMINLSIIDACHAGSDFGGWLRECGVFAFIAIIGVSFLHISVGRLL